MVRALEKASDVHATTDEIISGFDRAHVWFCDLDDDPQVELTGRSMLSLSERARAARLQNVERRRGKRTPGRAEV